MTDFAAAARAPHPSTPDWVNRDAAMFKVFYENGGRTLASPAVFTGDKLDDYGPVLRRLREGQSVVAAPDGENDTKIRVGITYSGERADQVALVIPARDLHTQIRKASVSSDTHVVVSLGPTEARVVAGRMMNRADEIAPLDQSAPRPEDPEIAALSSAAFAVIIADHPADLDDRLEGMLWAAARSMVRAGWRPSAE